MGMLLSSPAGERGCESSRLFPFLTAFASMFTSIAAFVHGSVEVYYLTFVVLPHCSPPPPPTFWVALVLVTDFAFSFPDCSASPLSAVNLRSVTII
jgi:hypothetical protein